MARPMFRPPVGRHRDRRRRLPQPGPEIGRHGRCLGRGQQRVPRRYGRWSGRRPAGLSGVTAIAAGGFHSLALKSDGTVVAWGGTGDVDDGQATSRPAYRASPRSLPAASTACPEIDGTVVAWVSTALARPTCRPASRASPRSPPVWSFSLAVEPGFATHLSVSTLNPYPAAALTA